MILAMFYIGISKVHRLVVSDSNEEYRLTVDFINENDYDSMARGIIGSPNKAFEKKPKLLKSDSEFISDNKKNIIDIKKGKNVVVSSDTGSNSKNNKKDVSKVNVIKSNEADLYVSNINEMIQSKIGEIVKDATSKKRPKDNINDLASTSKDGSKLARTSRHSHGRDSDAKGKTISSSINKSNPDDLLYDNGKSDTGLSLSESEMEKIRKQIVLCYRMAIVETGHDSTIPVFVTVELMRNGSIKADSMKVQRPLGYSSMDSEEFDHAVINAQVAISFCSPLRGMPAHKYRAWKKISFTFSNDDIR